MKALRLVSVRAWWIAAYGHAPIAPRLPRGLQLIGRGGVKLGHITAR